MNRLYLVSRHFIFPYFVCSFLSFLYEAVAGDHDEELPFAVVPMLSLCYAGFAYVHAELSAAVGLEQLGEASSFVSVYLKWEDCCFL